MTLAPLLFFASLQFFARERGASVRTVNVALDERSYPIHVGPGLLGAPLAGILDAAPARVLVVSNAVVWELYGAALTRALAPRVADVFKMPDGEQYKSLETYAAAMDFLMQHRHNRDTTVVALGGGVVGDLAGFVAATYQRGVNFIQIPTTLLAQVDSSVGGKTAVNHPAGKNMIGAFYQPRCVVIDTDVLKSLPPREYAAGLAEVVKYGVIQDADLFRYLEDHVDALNARDVEALTYVIGRSCEIKASVVERDEREGGLRAILNFGHTFGHAVEHLSGYGKWLHGEAVAVGMVMAADFSARLNLLDQGEAGRLARLLQALQLPTRLGTTIGDGTGNALTPDKLVASMGMDKKAVDGQIRFVVAKSIGEVEIISSYDQAALQNTLAQFCSSVSDTSN